MQTKEKEVEVFTLATTLILGGGTGGVVAANVLRRALGRRHKITLLDRKEKFNYASSFPLLIIGQRKAHQVSRNLAGLTKKGIEFIKTEIVAVKPQEFKVQTDGGTLEYDYLIISTGAEHHPEAVPGFQETAYNVYDLESNISLSNRLKKFRGGKVVVFISSLPIACPLAPYEMCFLLDDYFRHRGLWEKVKLSMVTPEPFPESLAHPSVGESMRKMLQKKQVELYTGAKVLFLDQGKGILQLDQGIRLEADLFLGIPPHWGPSFLAGSGLLDKGGWLEVDPHNLQTRNKRIYGIGDATSLKTPISKAFAPKAGVFAHFQAEVVARNLALTIRGEKERFRYKGKGMCIYYTGSGQARYTSVDYYHKPMPQVKATRPSKIAAWAKKAAERDFLNRWF
jgi:sulfide:quinone oxidoreductase